MSPRLTKIALCTATVFLSGGIGLWTATTGFAAESTPGPARPASGVDRLGRAVVPSGPATVQPEWPEPSVTPGTPGPSDGPAGACSSCINPPVGQPSLAPSG